MASLSIRAYARHRGVTHQAVRKAIAAGRIVVGPDGSIDPEQADRDWAASTAPRMATGTAGPPSPPAGAAVVNATAFTQGRTAKILAEAQRAALELRVRQGELLDRAMVLARVFAFVRNVRDAWLNWPSRVAAELAAALDVDQVRVAVELEARVRAHLEELADAQLDLDGVRRRA